MQWLKTWLRKCLGIDQTIATEHDLAALAICDVLNKHIYPTQKENDLLTQRIEVLTGEFVKLGVRVENLRENYRELFSGIQKDLAEAIRYADRDDKRICELESIVKDATLDTALADLEDRVARIESTPVPAAQNGRRGGSAWGPHQVAASAGALLEKGIPNPIPKPGVS